MNTLHLVAWRRGIGGTRVRMENALEAGYVVRRQDGDVPTITCLTCGHTSANQRDLDERYCGRCRRFHEGP